MVVPKETKYNYFILTFSFCGTITTCITPRNKNVGRGYESCYCCMQLSLVCIELVEHLPRMQNVMGFSQADQAAHSSLKMTMDELHCVVLYCFGSLLVRLFYKLYLVSFLALPSLPPYQSPFLLLCGVLCDPYLCKKQLH